MGEAGERGLSSVLTRHCLAERIRLGDEEAAMLGLPPRTNTMVAQWRAEVSNNT